MCVLVLDAGNSHWLSPNIKYLWIFDIKNIIFWMYSFQFLVLFQMKHLFFLPIVSLIC